VRPRSTWLIASSALALGVFALMWIGFASQWNWLMTMDASLLDIGHRQLTAHPGWAKAWNVFCTVLGPDVFRLATLVVIVVALVRRKGRVALFLAISVELTGILTEIAKGIAKRPRPATALVVSPSASFPSGHAFGVTVGVLSLLAVFVPLVRPRLRGWLIALGAVVVVAIGVGRVALNVHYPSDVIAGWMLGYAYFVACLLIVGPSWRNDRQPIVSKP
jgi:undecaprenyl-diphosphatase